MNKISLQDQERLAKKIADVVEGKPGFLLVGNYEDGKITTAITMQGISNGDLAVSVIRALNGLFSQSLPAVKK